MGKGGGSAKQQVADYYLSGHWRVAHPVDELLTIYVGEKEAWVGSATAEQDISIDRPDLFGGKKKEGGVQGIVRWLPGTPSQLLPSNLASRLGLTPSTAPGYRTMSSLFFTGANGGFLWSSNNPYLKSIWAKVRRRPRGLDQTYAMVPASGVPVSTNWTTVTVGGVTATPPQNVYTEINGVTVRLTTSTKTLIFGGVTVTFTPVEGDDNTITVNGITEDLSNGTATVGNYTVAASSHGMTITQSTVLLNANPAHIIYECLTDVNWGQGGAPSGIDTASFEAASVTLYNEGFGLFVTWTKQANIESFVSEILDHIHATLFVNPSTGLMTLKLIRADYDIDDLLILNADNCRIIQFDRKGWGETVNEIVATWTNPENEQEETIVAQNNANIAIQGGIISDSHNYYGVRTAELAQRLAYRDLAMSSWPLAVVEIEANRAAWDLVPGGCVRLQYPEYGIDDLVLRIAKVDCGKPGAPMIKLSTMEDIFALANAEFSDTDGTSWEDTSVDPDAPAYARAMTAPAYFIAQTLSAADAGTLDYPEVLPALLVSQNNDDTFGFDLYGTATLPTGQVVADLIGTRPTLGHAVLADVLAAEATTVLPSFGTVVGGPGPRPSSLVFIGNVAEQGHEIALIESFDEDGWVLRRGVLDTVPRAWPADTVVWFVNTDSRIVVTSSIYSAAETVTFKVAPTTSKGTLSFADATSIATTMTGRPHLPLRPSNVKVEGQGFGTLDLASTEPASVTVTWANRNRLTEDALIQPWDAGSVTPETGQTTRIVLLSTTGTVLTTHSGLTGTSFSVPAASWGDKGTADIAVYAERDGLVSLQSHRIRVRIRPGGWGDNWGSDWGGGTLGDPGEPDPGEPPVDPTPDPDFPTLPPWYGMGVHPYF